MSKNIVVCSDGTGNADVAGRGSNVFKLFEALELPANQRDLSLPRQIGIYHDGVGTEDFKPLKILGGAFGWGFSSHVRQLYTELARCYEPGDKIFLFGFSRGAFTARSLGGLIASVGLVDVRKANSDAELKSFVGKAYAAHRKCFRRFQKWRKSPPDPRPADEFRRDYAIEDVTPIEFVGVWDTVDAVGFPLDEVADFWHNVVYPFRFPDTNLNDNVRWARHAIAIDDERRTFHPELWNETEESKRTGRISQVWFAGVHSNVGGGYPKQGLSLVPLVWMMREAEASGLRFVSSVRELYADLQNPNDKLYDSRAGLSGYYAYKPRDMASICRKYKAEPRIHISVLERIALGTGGYAPGNIARNPVIVSDHPALDTSTAASVVESVFASRENYLQRARPWIGLWRISQAVFVVATVATLLGYFGAFGTSGFTDLMTLAGYRRMAEFLLASPVLSGILIVTYALCYFAAAKLHRSYSEFWFGARQNLRRALNLKAKGATP